MKLFFLFFSFLFALFSIFYLFLQCFWKDARVVEWAALEMRCTGNCTGGSNPSLSANQLRSGQHRNFSCDVFLCPSLIELAQERDSGVKK